jgi:hypothetical protein
MFRRAPLASFPLFAVALLGCGRLDIRDKNRCVSDSDCLAGRACVLGACTSDRVGGVQVMPTSGLVTSESGTSARFTVKLTVQPRANVALPLHSSNPGEGKASTDQLQFTPDNWSVQQTVLVTGVDDPVADGDQTYSIILEPLVSADSRFAGIDPPDVQVTNLDDKQPGFIVNPTGGLETAESGGTASFTVVLTSEPTAEVNVALSSTKPTEGTVQPTSLRFTALDWMKPQTVTITGVDDQAFDGDQPYQIVFERAHSTDVGYDGRIAPPVSVINRDDKIPQLVVTPAGPLATTEAGGAATFTVAFSRPPHGSAQVGVVSSNLKEGTVAPATLAFDKSNWSKPQTVTVTGVDDHVVNGTQRYTISVQVTDAGDDPRLEHTSPQVILVDNAENDHAGITVTAADGLFTTESGGTAVFTVVLTSQPTADVHIPLTSTLPAEGTVAPASLTFTPDTWSQAQTVTVTGVDDHVFDGPRPYSITVGPATSQDSNYSWRSGSTVNLINHDADVSFERAIVGSDGSTPGYVDQLTGIADFGMSDDARYVVFTSTAALTADDHNNVGDIFVRDRTKQTTTRVSLTSDGKEANKESNLPVISGDGNVVAFASLATNLVPNPPREAFYVRDLPSGQVSILPLTVNQQSFDFKAGLKLSRDGHLVLFGATQGGVFVFDRNSGATERVDVDASGKALVGTPVGMSGDGRFVLFIVYGSGGTGNQLYLRDRTQQKTTQLASAWVLEGDISADGSQVVWTATEPDGFGNYWSRTAGYDVANAQGYGVDLDPSQLFDFKNGISVLHLSGDGRYISFRGKRNGLATEYDPQHLGRYDRVTNTEGIVTMMGDGTYATHPSYGGELSFDGSVMLLYTFAPEIIPPPVTSNVSELLCARINP